MSERREVLSNLPEAASQRGQALYKPSAVDSLLPAVGTVIPFSGGSDQRKISAAQLGEIILSCGHRFAVDGGGLLNVWETGAYRPYGAEFVARAAKGILSKLGLASQWSTYKTKEAAKWIATDSPRLWERPPIDVVNVRNGLLDLKTGTLQPHSPDFLSPIQLPVTFDPAADCPGWEAFLNAVFPRDAIPVAWEILGWLMVPYTGLQKALMLTGSGANGKSRFLAGLRAFLGEENVSSVPLHKLEENRFSSARLIGKLANIFADLPERDLDNTSVFKSLTGGDAIEVERKFEAGFEVRPFARLVFSCNRPPLVRDATPAFFRRWLVVPFDVQLAPHERIPEEELDALLASPAELSGVLNKSMEGWRRLQANKAFTSATSLETALQNFRAACNPLEAWLQSNTVRSPGASIHGDALYEAYRLHCENTGQPVVSREAFGRQMRRLHPDIPYRQVVDAEGRRVRVYEGLGWK
jgi:putative DNA primase/helicase